MSIYSLVQKQYRSDFDYIPSQANHRSMSRPISDTGGTNGRPPPTFNPPTMNENSSSSSRNNEHVIQSYPIHRPLSSHQSTFQRPGPEANRFPSSSCQSQSCNDKLSLDLPPLNNIPDLRKQYPELISSNDLSPEESGEDGPGLPSVLDKFKLGRPQSPKNSYPLYTLHQSLETMSIRHQIDSRSQNSTTYHPSTRHKPGRSTRCKRAEIMAEPYFRAIVTKALHGGELDDITPSQIKELVTRQMVSSECASKWEHYAEYKPDSANPKNEFRCRICGYNAKRQLIARHINGPHLGIKIFGCPFCGNTYSQIMSVMCHIAVHLGVFPYKCSWCDQRFNDVARHHRHIQKEHGYQAKETKRTSKSKKSDST